MRERSKNLCRRTVLDNLAPLHDGNFFTDGRRNAQIMRDEQHRQSKGFPRVIQKFEHLLLDRDIKGRDRFVGNDQRAGQLSWVRTQSLTAYQSSSAFQRDGGLQVFLGDLDSVTPFASANR
jgi:hypothetical protein